MRRPNRLLLAFLGAIVLAIPRGALAQESLSFVNAPDPRVRVDGWLREWSQEPMQRLSRSSTSAMSFVLGYDANGLYVAASVSDDRLVRTERPGANEDAIVLTLALPGPNGLVTTDLWLYAGVSGRSAASVAIGPAGRTRPLASARIVEMPTARGYDLEAFVPWRDLGGNVDWMRGRGRIRFLDVDAPGGGTPAVLESAPMRDGDPSSLPFFTGSDGELGALASFLRDRGLQRTQVVQDLRGDVASDPRPERVVVAGSFLAVMGDGYLNGDGYDFASVGTVGPRGITSAELVDVTGDGKAELVLVASLRDGGDEAETVRVYQFSAMRVMPLLSVEIGVRVGGGEITGVFAVETARGALPGLRVRGGEARGVTPSSYRRRSPSGTVPPLLPWGDVRSRLYRWDGRQLAMVEEERVEAPPATAPVASTPPRSTTPPANAPANPPPGPNRPPPPAAWSPAPLIASLRRDQGIAASVPARFEQNVDLAEDGQPERVFIIGKAFAILGPAYRGGTGYFFSTLGVAAPEDILGLSTADVTGDGKHELLIRARQAWQAPFWAEMLLVYTVDANGARPILTAHLGMHEGTTRSVVNEARPTGRGNTAALVVAPGRAQGFDASNWPFAPGAPAGITPLLLPWQDREVRYRFDGTNLVAAR